ncbi:MAG: flagellar hook-basal body protein [Pseudomonadales bacterium]
MTTAIDLSELSMINAMRQLDTISHNLANANTAGFKRDMVVTRKFESMLDAGLQPTLDTFQIKQRQLVPEMQLRVDHAPGALRHTGNAMDLAIEGDAYFELRGDEGLRYSRLGSFSIDATGRLVNSQGLVVNAEAGDLLLSGGEVTVNRDGAVHENGEYIGKLKLMHFSDTSVLVKTGHGLMRATGQVTAQIATDSGVRQGYQEASNVRPMEEMVSMITTLRHFEATSNVIKAYDEMMSTAISTIAEF